MWIREMQRADIPEVEKLEQLCFSDPWSENLLAAMLENKADGAFILEDGGEVIGYANPRIGMDEGELMRICLIPASRGKGLSKLLMERAMDYFKSFGIKEVTLEVRTKNIPAVKLYESFGFLCEGLRKGYYHDPEDDAAVYWFRRNTKDKKKKPGE